MAESTTEMELTIIVKSNMYGGKCYIGWRSETPHLWRPVLTTEEDSCCWPADTSLTVGHSYKFRVTKMNPREIPNPYRVNDVLVEEEPAEVNITHDSLYDILVDKAVPAVDAVFHPGKIFEKKYIKENEECPSVGILKCTGDKLEVYQENGKYKLKIEESSSQKIYHFPITAEDFDEEFLEEDNVLIILGLGRPFAGEIEFNPKRCYILVIGIIVE